MSGHRVRAITRRLLQGFRRDRRTLALLFVAPIIILGLLGYLLRGSSSAPAVGVANQDSGPAGAMIADLLRHSTRINASDIDAAQGDAKLKDGEITFHVKRDFGGQEVTIHYKGKVEKDAIKGKIEFERDGEKRERMLIKALRELVK